MSESNNPTPKSVKEYFAALGRKGGKAKGIKKVRAGKAGAKVRWKGHRKARKKRPVHSIGPGAV